MSDTTVRMFCVFITLLFVLICITLVVDDYLEHRADTQPLIERIERLEAAILKGD